MNFQKLIVKGIGKLEGRRGEGRERMGKVAIVMDKWGRDVFYDRRRVRSGVRK